ncbi:hypothetical protein [Arsenicibacter rosenii]|uniref:Uncharacterized protein n=1 Tax=Arsenicibacter rosenii TaxID=1750698 RepID=A0A1S2VAW9_9BACT|nr:hypothetical protein [Arsenicibacter rosenii]OIN55843.1 hypothetical protein BLX24_27695 [Arsenicibacter rosenii]
MKRTYKDLNNDQLAALHRAALGLPVEVTVTVYREMENTGVHPFVSTHHSEDEAVLFWWNHDNALSTDAGMQDINYLAAADLARQFGIA